MASDLPEARDLPYWKTSKSSAEEWVRKACRHIEEAGGRIELCLPSAFQAGRVAHVIGFAINGDSFKLIWPVLAHDPPDDSAAVRQAATMLYHDVKSRVVAARVFGARWAFHAELLLPGGQTAGQLTSPELLEQLPPIALLGHDTVEVS